MQTIRRLVRSRALHQFRIQKSPIRGLRLLGDGFPATRRIATVRERTAQTGTMTTPSEISASRCATGSTAPRHGYGLPRCNGQPTGSGPRRMAGCKTRSAYPTAIRIRLAVGCTTSRPASGCLVPCMGPIQFRPAFRVSVRERIAVSTFVVDRGCRLVVACRCRIYAVPEPSVSSLVSIKSAPCPLGRVVEARVSFLEAKRDERDPPPSHL